MKIFFEKGRYIEMRMLLQKRFQLIMKRLSPWIRPFDYPSLLPELVSTFSVVSKGTVIGVFTLDRFGFKKVKIAVKHFWSETFIKTFNSEYNLKPGKSGNIFLIHHYCNFDGIFINFDILTYRTITVSNFYSFIFHYSQLT